MLTPRRYLPWPLYYVCPRRSSRTSVTLVLPHLAQDEALTTDRADPAAGTASFITLAICRRDWRSGVSPALVQFSDSSGTTRNNSRLERGFASAQFHSRSDRISAVSRCFFNQQDSTITQRHARCCWWFPKPEPRCSSLRINSDQRRRSGAKHCRKTDNRGLVGLHRKALTSFGAARANNRTTAPRFHPGAKSVGALALDF